MAGPKYTEAQLELLKDSPLVKKPDGLPDISQWMDVPAEQNNGNNNAGTNANRRARPTRTGDAATEALNNPMGQFARRQSTQHGEDTVLGPPKFNFASATRATKNKDATTAITSVDGEHVGDRFPKPERGERWRDGERNREKPYANGRRGAREDGEGWAPTNAKGRKSLNQDDFDRGFGRNGDRDAENGEGTTRRGNARWGRRDENAKEGEGNRFTPGGQGGWRDRERVKEREKDREWTRGTKEEDPEWMDAPVEKEAKVHTQEDFHRWLEQSRAKGNRASIEEHDEPQAEIDHAEEATPALPVAQPPPLKMALGLEPNLGGMFGAWGKDPLSEQALEAPPPKAKPDKKSRFMGTIISNKLLEEPVALPPQEQPGSPGMAPERNADREGFNRILQMLGGVSVNAAPSASPGIPTPTNDNRPRNIPLDFPHYSSPPAPETQNPRAPQPPNARDKQTLLENILGQQRLTGLESRQQGYSSMSPDNALHDRFGAPRAESRFPGEEYPSQPPPRNQNVQDPNLAVILNNRDANRERESKEFLLTLMQQPRNTPPQMLNHNVPRQAQENQSMSFFDQPGQRPQGQPKGRGGLPPGFMEDPRIFENEMMMRREAEHRERQLQMRELQQQQESMRTKPRGMPMGGFPSHDDPGMGLQRRNTAGEIPRQLTNMGIPSQPVPDLPSMYSGRQPGMPPTPQDRPNIAPPPGFTMRQPPGLGGPGLQQQMGPGPSFSAGNTPLGHPPGFPPPNNMRGGFGGPGGPGNGMQGPPPQGYFPPPGYGPPPPMNMRGEDPRMMFEQQFGGPGPRQQGRPGPPNMY